MKPMHKRGFTLIEVMVAVLIVGAVGMTSARTLQTLMNIQSKNDTESRAIVLAQDQLEDLRNQEYDLLDDGTSTTTDGYTLTWVVTENPVLVTNGPPEPNLKLIVLTVAWNWKGVAQSYELNTVLTQVQQ